METLKEQWLLLAKKYSSDIPFINQCFDIIWNAYNETHRYYHNIDHIYSMILEITNYQNNDLDRDSLLFATWFHDIIYNPKKNDNEAESAEVAIRILKQLYVPEEKIQLVKELILATSNHTSVNTSNINLNFFLDCDLKVLGFKREDYLLYAENIRKEYNHVIDFIYKMGRKKILKRFIGSAAIYRTDYFKNKYEEQAKNNISFELQIL